MEIVNRPLDQLKPFAKNPKKHPEKQISYLIKSMREFGYTAPILITADNMIIAGHARYEAAKQIGLAEVPTILIDLPYNKAVAYVIADNQLAKLAEDDEVLLRELLEEVTHIPDFDIEAVGFDTDEVDLFLDNLETNPYENYVIPEDSKEYDESIADEVKAIVCPHCGFKFPDK